MGDRSDPTHRLIIGELSYDVVRSELRNARGNRLHLRAQSTKVLAELAKGAGEVIERRVLIEAVWGDIAVTDDSLTQCISEIRKAMGENNRKYLRTVSKSGFILDVNPTETTDLESSTQSCFFLIASGPDLPRLENYVQKLRDQMTTLDLVEYDEGEVRASHQDASVLIGVGLELSKLRGVRVGLSTTYEGRTTARALAQTANSGQVLATIDMWDAKQTTVNHDFKDLGFLNTQHNMQAMRVIEILPNVLQPLHSLFARATDLRPTIIVIPPHAQNADAHEKVLGAVIADEVTSALSASPDLNVISRMSAELANRNQMGLTALSDMFGVDFVVSGYFRDIGGKIHIGLEFADTRTNKILWFEKFQTSLEDLLNSSSALEEVNAKITRSIFSNEIEKLESQSLITLGNFSLLFGAIGLMHRLSQSDFQKSRVYLNALMERLPDQPIVLAWLSRWFILRIHQGWSEDAGCDAKQALDCTKRALDIEPDNTLALSTEGHVLTNLYRRFDLAEDRFERSLSINPNDAISHLLQGTFFAFQGEGQKAEQSAARALQLSPFDPHRFFFLAHAAGASLANGENERALELANSSLKGNRLHASTLRIKSVAHVRMGEMDLARKTVAQLMGVQPNLNVATWLANSPSGNFETGKRFALDMKIAGVPS